MSNSMDSSIQWLEQLASTLDSDPDIIDYMPIEDVRNDLASFGIDSDNFYSRISKLIEPTFEERLKKKIKNGIEKFDALLSVIPDIFPQQCALVPVAVRSAAKVKDTHKVTRCKHYIEDPNPIYPFSIPDNLKYQTLILCHLDKKSITILYSNWEIEEPFSLRPEFEEDDLGENRLYLILTDVLLDIEENEDFITDDRLEKILSHVESIDNKYLACIDISIENRP